MKYPLFFYPLIVTVLLLASSGTALAVTPSVSSFSVTPSAIGHGQPVNITWTLSDAISHALLVSCPQGVTARTTGGSIFTCGMRTSVSNQPSDGTTLVISNNSGSQRTVSVSIIPKDAVTSYDSAMQTLNFTVIPNTQPISSFTVATSTESGSTVNLSWSVSADVPATNLIIGCTADITVTAPSSGTANLPCGTVIYPASDMSAGGSLGLVFTNKSNTEISVPLTLIPAIVAGSYDATHGVQANIIVKPAKMLNPTITSIVVSPSPLISGKTASLSWATQDIPAGINLRFSCNQNISVAKVISGATTTVACGTYIFDQPITTSSASIILTNLSFSNQTITAGFVPANPGNTYNGLKEQSMNITVYGMGVTTTPAVIAPSVIPSTPQLSPVSAPGVTTPTPASPSSSSSSQNKFTFAKALARGYSGTDVRELQKFFAKYPEIYGKVTVNGLFGPATEKLVMKFQEKYSIAKKGNAGYGFVGPATRKKLNELQ